MLGSPFCFVVLLSYLRYRLVSCFDLRTLLEKRAIVRPFFAIEEIEGNTRVGVGKSEQGK